MSKEVITFSLNTSNTFDHLECAFGGVWLIERFDLGRLRLQKALRWEYRSFHLIAQTLAPTLGKITVFFQDLINPVAFDKILKCFGQD